jgi:MerR family transcriptional regulator/heat shock protein HspR
MYQVLRYEYIKYGAALQTDSVRERRTRIQPEIQREEGSDTLPGSISIRQRPEHLSLEQRSNRTGRRISQQRPPNRQEVQGVYIISVAARLLEMHPQTLRKYERLGMVRPVRTVGMLRLYSESDIKKLRLIRHLETDMGMNLAGVRFILDLLEQLLKMHERLTLNNNHQTMNAIMDREIKRLFQEMNLPLSMWR